MFANELALKAEPLSETIRTALPKISDQILNFFNVSLPLVVFVASSQINFVSDSTIANMYLYCLPVVFVPNRSRHLRVTQLDKGVMSTCRWHGDALLAGRSRRGNGNDGYCVAGPQAMRNCAEVELT